MSAIDSQLPSSSGQDRPTDEVDRILSPGKLIILGLQHVLVMYAGAVAVPLMIGDRLGLSKEAIAMLISSDLFCCGIVTLLQCIGIGRFMGIRLPVIMSVTFAAVTPMIAIGMNPDIGLLGIFGATIAAGFITTLLAPLIGRLMPLFPPLVTAVLFTHEWCNHQCRSTCKWSVLPAPLGHVRGVFVCLPPLPHPVQTGRRR